MLSRLLTRKEQAVLLGFAAAIAVGAAALVVHGRASRTGKIVAVAPGTDANPSPAPRPSNVPLPSQEDVTPPQPPSPEPVVVSIQGAVREPGVYTTEGGSRIQDLIERAGGTHESADLSNINLAAKLVDGTTLVIPSWAPNDPWSAQASANPPNYTISGQASPITESANAPSAVGAFTSAGNPGTGRINLNTASQSELESLPGIGPKYAQEIIRMRQQAPFRTVDDVAQVRGIGEKRLEAIRPLVTVR